MNPVIGLDVFKGESHAQAFLDRGVPHGKIFRFNHDLEGLSSFLNYVRAVESAAGMSPCIVMEATGHYHSPVVQFLDQHQYLYIVINPLISYEAKKTNLRRVKTDAADVCYGIIGFSLTILSIWRFTLRTIHTKKQKQVNECPIGKCILYL